MGRPYFNLTQPLALSNVIMHRHMHALFSLYISIQGMDQSTGYIMREKRIVINIIYWLGRENPRVNPISRSQDHL